MVFERGDSGRVGKGKRKCVRNKVAAPFAPGVRLRRIAICCKLPEPSSLKGRRRRGTSLIEPLRSVAEAKPRYIGRNLTGLDIDGDRFAKPQVMHDSASAVPIYEQVIRRRARGKRPHSEKNHATRRLQSARRGARWSTSACRQ